jgi:hypothetical protein
MLSAVHNRALRRMQLPVQSVRKPGIRSCWCSTVLDNTSADRLGVKSGEMHEMTEQDKPGLDFPVRQMCSFALSSLGFQCRHLIVISTGSLEGAQSK